MNNENQIENLNLRISELESWKKRHMRYETIVFVVSVLTAMIATVYIFRIHSFI